MANKQYISIIRLFDHCSIPYDGEVNVARIKKQLNAEFDFTKDGFIEIDGYHYSKHDVLEETENENFIRRLQYHKKIWENKNVLTVLEDNVVNIYDIRAELDKFRNDKDFDSFFSPYFAAPFNHICRNFLTDGNLYDLSSWLLFQHYIQPAEKEEAFRSVRLFLDENIRIFKNINTENYKTFRPQIIHWIETGWDEFINNLPEDYFYYKHDITVELINLTVKIQRKQRKDAKAISGGLMRIKELDSNLMETVYNNDQVFNKTASSSSSGYGWVVWVVIIFIKVVVFSGGCN